MEGFDIYKDNKHIFTIFSDSEFRAIELSEIFCKESNDLKVIKKDKDNVCSGCKEKIVNDIRCFCWVV